MKRNRKNKQIGAALIEVMLASLVLTLGGISYLKLQRIGLQSSYNDHARSQATSIVQGFSDSLRSNIKFTQLTTEQKNGFIYGALKAAKLPQTNENCQSAQPGKKCALATLQYHSYLANRQMLDAFPVNESILCYLENPSKRGNIRITSIWRDTLNAKTKISSESCPKEFEKSLSTDDEKNYKANSVTIYVQL